jgi:hypothetical protein
MNKQDNYEMSVEQALRNLRSAADSLVAAWSVSGKAKKSTDAFQYEVVISAQFTQEAVSWVNDASKKGLPAASYRLVTACAMGAVVYMVGAMAAWETGVHQQQLLEANSLLIMADKELQELLNAIWDGER